MLIESYNAYFYVSAIEIHGSEPKRDFSHFGEGSTPQEAIDAALERAKQIQDHVLAQGKGSDMRFDFSDPRPYIDIEPEPVYPETVSVEKEL